MANIRTIALNGAEIKVEIAGQNCAVRNDGTETVYASRRTGIIAGADGVLAVPAGQSAVLRDTCGTLYLLGTGSVQLVGADYDSLPFKTVSASGGSGADEVARAAISAHAGNAEVHVTADEKSAWNAKAELSDIPTSLPANGGNADTVDGKYASDFASSAHPIITGNITMEVNNTADYKGMIIPWIDNSIRLRTVDRDEKNYADLVIRPDGSAIIEKMEEGEVVSRRNTSDGGNAAALENHPASDFVLKSEYDALAARVAALEGGA